MNVRIAKIRREIRLFGNLTPGQRERLLEAARRCPVSNSLGSVPVQEEVLVED
ncbi:MAG: OsmC family protein [Nitrospinota bacterium]